MQRHTTGASRRLSLQAAGVSLALPALESVAGGPLSRSLAFGAADETKHTAPGTPRMVCIGNMLGFVPQARAATSSSPASPTVG